MFRNFHFIVVSFFLVIVFQLNNLKCQNSNDYNGNENFNKPFEFGVTENIVLTLENSGYWNTKNNGDKEWTLELFREEATSLSLMFNKFYLPKGATVELSARDQSEKILYTSEKNPKSKKLGTWPLKGNKIIIKYTEPHSQRGKAEIEISQLVKGKKNKQNNKGSKIAETPFGCDIDAQCATENETINSLKDRLIHSVVLINSGFGFCTGTLINNVRNDRKLYLLTANHCILTENLDFWSFRFNFFNDSSICANPGFETFSEFQVLNGAKILARNAETDFALLELEGNLDPNWNVEWAGWDRNTINPELSFGLHHPSGNPTKIAIDYDVTFAEEILFRETQTKVWTISADAGGWDVGITAGGSSGSALFNSDGNIVGQLVGGKAECISNVDNDEQDYYGRFTDSWNISPNMNESLMHWLDPDNTNAEMLNMYSKERALNDEVVNLFPNPTTSNTLYLDRFIEGRYEIYDMKGVLVLKNKISFFSSINVTSLALGTYILKVFPNSGNEFVKQFIKTN